MQFGSVVCNKGQVAPLGHCGPLGQMSAAKFRDIRSVVFTVRNVKQLQQTSSLSEQDIDYVKYNVGIINKIYNEI